MANDSIKAKVVFTNLDEHLKRSVEKKQKIIDTEVIKNMDPYTPMQSGTLVKSVVLHTQIGSGKIVQKTPYARYLYYGEIMGPNIPITVNGQIAGFYSPKGQAKTLTGRPLTYDTAKHPLAGKLWFERMKADKKAEILKKASDA